MKLAVWSDLVWCM